MGVWGASASIGMQQCGRRWDRSSEESLEEDHVEHHPLPTEGPAFVIQPICCLVWVHALPNLRPSVGRGAESGHS